MKNSDAASRTSQVQPSAFDTITPSAKYSDADRKPWTIPNSAGEPKPRLRLSGGSRRESRRDPSLIAAAPPTAARRPRRRTAAP
jgi:hypothetical protein